jgi:hypothetical protein
LFSPPEQALALDLGRQCDECGRVVGKDEALIRCDPFGTDLCDLCTQLQALMILGGNRANRRRAESRAKKKGDRKRKRKKR